MSSRAFRTKSTLGTTFYPRHMGRRGAAASHHYLAVDAALDILKDGGNAVDATVAAVLVEGVTNPQMHGLGGECPILIRMANDRRVYSINGNTAAPGKATRENYLAMGFSTVPDEGIFAAGVPAALGSLLTALLRFGRRSFSAVSSPALQLAREGFPAHRGLLRQERFGLYDLANKFRTEWPGSAEIYFPGGLALSEGDTVRNSRLADLFDYLATIEKGRGADREAGLRSVLEEFYKGDPAAAIDKFSKDRGGFLARGDLERFETLIEDPAALDFCGVTLFKCGFWNQGPALLQTLAILQNWQLSGLGHNSGDYLHLLIEATKLAYADREQWYGDPAQTEVPAAALLSAEYAKQRAGLIDSSSANAALRPGDPRGDMRPLLAEHEQFAQNAWGPGTVHVDVADKDGTMVAATPSGGWLKSSEVMPSLGFPLGNRLMTFYLDPRQHPNCIAPYRRPRTTISPSLATKDGQPWMAFGSMGGDQQDQWQLQFFLNCVVFGMSIQEAIEAPKVSSEHFPAFFSPHDSFPNRVRAEPRIGKAILRDLASRGHDVDIGPDWSEGHLLAVARDPVSGLLEAGCDPRSIKSEVFPASARCWN